MTPLDPLDAHLSDLRQAFADLALIVTQLQHLRTRAQQLHAPLADELRRLRALIDETLPHLTSLEENP